MNLSRLRFLTGEASPKISALRTGVQATRRLSGMLRAHRYVKPVEYENRHRLGLALQFP
jgi:hypothetical protein